LLPPSSRSVAVFRRWCVRPPPPSFWCVLLPSCSAGLYSEQLTAELKTTEAENNDLCNEIEELKQTQIRSACQLEGELETLNYVLDNYKPMDNREVRERAPVDGSNQSGTCRLSKEHDE
ncbi:hypothetical protein V2J09_006095, partial [Rumex salicifolius]